MRAKTGATGCAEHSVGLPSIATLIRRRAMSILGALVGAPVLRGIVYAQPPLPLLAILEPGSAAGPQGGVPHFLQALAKLGWDEGRTIRIVIRYGEWRIDHMAAMGRELVARKPAVLYTHSDQGARSAMQATTTNGEDFCSTAPTCSR
jgi:hypothetical protein